MSIEQLKEIKLLPSALLLFALYINVTPASAADFYKLGSASYAQGNFPLAKTQLAKATMLTPKSWKAHYELANTFVALKNSGAAKMSYQKCLTCNPPEDIKKRCKDAISYISTNPTLKAPDPVAVPITVQLVTPRASASPSGTTASTGADPAVNADLEARKARILADASASAERLRKEQKERLDELESSSNQRYLYPDGTIKTSADPEQERAVKREYETKINAIMEDAKRRAAALTH